MSDVRITDVETHMVANPWKPWVFVRLHTDAGATGLAEATTHDKPRTVAAAIEEIIEVSESGEAWSPKMPPERVAPSTSVAGRPSPSASGSAIGIMMAKAVHEEPSVKAAPPFTTKMVAGIHHAAPTPSTRPTR